MKNLTLTEFNAMRPEDRLYPIIDSSSFISESWSGAGRSRFYGINDFYAEVIYDRSGKRIIDVVGFESGERLERMTQHTVLSEKI
jgi:hypothetical protein